MTREIKPVEDWRAFGELRRYIRHGSFDVVHAHSSKAGFLTRLAVGTLGTRAATVYTPHALATNISPIYWLAERVAGFFTDALIAVSESEAEDIAATGIIARSRVCTIFNGIPATRTQPAPRSHSRHLVGCVGRLSDQKNPDLFFEIAQDVCRRSPDVDFVWIGGGDRDRLEELRSRTHQAGLDGRLNFTGHVPDLAPWLSRLDVFLSCSRYEGFAYALLEAMSFGIPVIATDVTGNRDAVADGRTGYLFPQDDISRGADLLLGLCADPGVYNMMRMSASIRSQEFPIDRMIEETLALYGRLLGKSAGPSKSRPAMV